MFFKNREEAGAALAARLKPNESEIDFIVGIPRGGLPVAKRLAKELDRSFDVILTEKIPLPTNPDAGCGTLTELGVHVLNQPLIASMHLSQSRIDYLISQAQRELDIKKKIYRRFHKFPELNGCQVILVDDGMVTGYSAIAAIRSLRKAGCTRVTLALPVTSENALHAVEGEADEVITLNLVRDPYFRVSASYEDFHTLTEEDVGRMLG